MQTIKETKADHLSAPALASPTTTLGLVYGAWFLSLAASQLFTLLFFFFLSPVQVGLINWATAAGAIIFYLLEGGVETALVVTAKQDAVSLARMTTVVGMIRLATAGVTLVALLIAALSGLVRPLEATVLFLVGLSFVLKSLQTPFSTALYIRDKQATVAIAGLVQAGGRLVAFFFLWVVALLNVVPVLLAGLVGDCAGLLFLIAMAVRVEGPVRPDEAPARRLALHLLRNGPLVAASQAVMIVQARVDWLLVAAFTSYGALANYSIANKAIELLVLFGSVFGRTALPWFVEGWENRNLARPVRVLMLGTSACALLLAVLGAPLLHLAFRNKYVGATQVIPVLAAIGPGLVALQVVQFALLGKNRAMDTVIAGSAGISAQILVDFMLIPRLGILGAAAGMCAFTLVALPLTLRLAVKRTVIRRQVSRELLLSSAIAPALVGLSHFLIHG